MLKRICTAMLSGMLLLTGVQTLLFAGDTSAENGVAVTPVDGVNVTRWADLLVVYQNRPTTGQNEWGHNVVVGADGVVQSIIPGGDLAGKDLAIPDGGMVVSATGNKTQWLVDHISVGMYVRFDEVTGRVMVSETDDFDVSFSVSMPINAHNDIRHAGYVVLYDRSLQKTGTNGYGYEICVSADGVVLSSGGNDNTVPENGYVLSVIEPADRLFLKTYGVVGATCTLSADRTSFTLTYGEKEIRQSMEMRLRELQSGSDKAEAECLLVDTEAVRDALTEARVYTEGNDLTRLEVRNRFYALCDRVRRLLAEQKYVETRGVWYVPLERDREAVDRTVREMASRGVNQLCLGIGNTVTVFPVPAEHPFRQDIRLRSFDLLGAYVDACKKEGIELVVSVTVFYDNQGAKHPEWLTKANREGGAEEGVFYSPASDAYEKVFSEYIAYLLDNYEIDGLQLDYIRYPYFDGSTDYGYDEETKRKFAEAEGVALSALNGIETQLRSHPLWARWSDFRRALVTGWVERLHTLVREKRPDVYFSVCLAADASPESYFQDGKRWVEEGLVDAVYPMSYAEGIMQSQTEYFSSFDGDYYCIEGSGSYQSFSKQEQLLQVEQTRRYGADGICFFEWGAYVAHGYAEDLQESAFAAYAYSPTGDPDLAAQACVKGVLERVRLAALRGYVTQEVADALAEAASYSLTDFVSETRRLLAEHEAEAWYTHVEQDLATVEKVRRLAKTEYRAPQETSGEVSAEPEESEVPTDEKTPSGVGVTVGAVIGVIAGVIALCGVAVCIFLRDRKK